MSNHDNDNMNVELVKAKLTEYKDDIHVPEPSNWEHVHAEIVKRTKKKTRISSIKKAMSIVAACIVLLLFVNTQNGSVSAGFKTFYKKISNQFVQIFMFDNSDNVDSEGALTAPPDPYDLTTDVKKGIITSPQNNNVEESIEVTPIQLNSIPEGFELVSSYITSSSDHTGQYIFANDNNVQIIIIIEKYLEITKHILDININYSYYREDFINDNRAVIVTDLNGVTTIEWVDQNQHKYTIVSSYDREELFKLASTTK